MMKKYIALLFCLLIFACSSDDDENTLDLDLLRGQWYRTGLCRSQNSLLLNNDNTYVSFSSGGVDCESTETDTYRYSGTYSISNNAIAFNLLEEELIIDGSNLSISEITERIYTRIVVLDEEQMVIETKSRTLQGDVIHQAHYEH
jgi:hypothetical protein